MSEADQEKARAMYDSWFADGDRDDEIVGDIAAALAEERKKARAPFLALADEFEGNPPETYVPGYRYLAGRIRRAAEVTE